jgi:hypothetical protein
MVTPIQTSSPLEKARKRLFRQKRQLRSWHKVADARKVNVSYVYEFAEKGIVPTNKKIQRALGIHLPRSVTINQLLQLPIQDMPVEILRLAFENRKEMING